MIGTHFKNRDRCRLWLQRTVNVRGIFEREARLRRASTRSKDVGNIFEMGAGYGLLNQYSFAAVFFLATILLLSYANVSAQPTESEDEEQEVDLDALDEGLSEHSENSSNDEEKFLLVNPVTVDIERNPAFALVALIVLIPLSALLLPSKRMRKGKLSRPRQNRKTNG